MVMANYYKKDDLVIFHAEERDEEDHRTYTYHGEFKLKDYQNAVKEMQEKGESEITGKECSLTMERLHDGKSRLRFSSVPDPDTTPGGLHLSGSLNNWPTIEELVKFAFDE